MLAARVWIDIENPPQVQYLLPLRPAFEEAGASVVVTARDYGETFELLRARNGHFVPIGARPGKRKWQKALGLVGRARELVSFVSGDARPTAVVSASRSAALAARRLRVPSFMLCDYEYVHLGVHRLTRSFVLHPEVIEPARFEQRGIARERLIAFAGLKEDITFSHLDVDAIPAFSLPGDLSPDLVRVLVRPAAEESHYYRSASGHLTLELLAHLAAQKGVVVVFSPRYPWQADYLGRFEWAVEPIVLREPVPFVSLLKSLDAVVSSGGTMVREAAYLGIPAYSTFGGQKGAVDRHLEGLGRLRSITSEDDFGALELTRRPADGILRSNPRLAEDLVQLVLKRAVPAA